MKNTSRITLSLFTFILFHTCNMQAVADNIWEKNLALELSIDEANENTKKGVVPLTIILVNKTNKKLSFVTPENPLSVSLLTQQGKNLSMFDLLLRVGDDPDTKIDMVIKPKETIAFKRDLKLSRHSHRIESETFVKFEATFVLFSNGDKITIDSNVLKYSISNKK